MTKIEFTIKGEESGLVTEELMEGFFRETLEPRLLELLKVITRRNFSVSSVKTKKWGPSDPGPKVYVELDGEVRGNILNFVVEHLRSEYPNHLKDW